MFRKYSDSFAQYLLENLSSNSVDSSSDSESTNGNNSECSVERNVGHESPTIILLDSDDEEANEHFTESTIPPSTVTPTSITPPRTTPTRITPTTRSSSPTIIENGKNLCPISIYTMPTNRSSCF